MAPPVDLPSTITLRIKVPPGHIEGAGDEFTLGTKVPVNAKIGEVRERIQRAVPSNPPPERQRLLYGGRALVDNEQTLADALNIRRDPTQDEYVVHLLVKGDGTATAPVPHRRGVSTPGRASPAEVGQQLPVARDATQQAGHVHQQHVQQHQAALAAQQRQLLHNLNHVNQATGPNPAQLPVGLHQLHVGGGLPTMPLGQQFVQYQDHGMPPQHGQVHTQQIPATQAQQFRAAQAEGGTGLHTTQDPLVATGQRSGQSRSASQPPPRPHGHGVVLEGRGPNGEHFHFQQHVHVGPQAVLPPTFGLQHVPQLAQQQPAPRRPGPSALEQARDHIAEMRRMLSELRGLDVATEEQREQIDRLQQRTQEVHNYIDPFNLSGSSVQGNSSLNDARPANTAQGISMARPASQPPRIQNVPPFPSVIHQMAPAAATSPPPTNVTCYLLSSPTGPQAILFSPQHGTYTNSTSPAAQAIAGAHAAPTRQPEGLAAQAPAVADVQPPVNLAQAPAAQPGAAPAQQGGLGGIGPGLINHMWLLMRVLIFAYFILGANLGWRRPLALLAIALGFWLLRQGPLGEGGILRRWWDGIINQNQQPQPAQGNGQQPVHAQVGDARPGQMPTPAQVAQRLLDEDQQQRNHRLSWLREQIRPAERAAALLIASLWPGVGEAYVRALEAEERRRNEEEVAARRREEEERQRREEEEKQKTEASGTTDAAKNQVDGPRANISNGATAAGESSEKTDLVGGASST